MGSVFRPPGFGNSQMAGLRSRAHPQDSTSLCFCGHVYGSTCELRLLFVVVLDVCSFVFYAHISSVSVFVHVCLHVYIYIYLYMCVPVYLNIYIYTHICSFIYVYMQSFLSLGFVQTSGVRQSLGPQPAC